MVHLDVAGFQTHHLGLGEVLRIAGAEVISQRHLQCCVGSARLEQGAVILKAMTGGYKSLSLQELSNVGDIQREKNPPHAVLMHWSRGSITIGLFSSQL